MPDFREQITVSDCPHRVGPEAAVSAGIECRERRALTIDLGIGSDIPAIRQIVGEAWVELYEPHFSLDGVAEDIRKYLNDDSIQEMLDNPLGLMLVARDPLTQAPKGVLYGFGSGDCETAELLYLYLSPSARGSGAGNALLLAFEKHFSDHQQLQLEVFASNTGAQGFYERAGYGRAGECQGTIGDIAGTWHVMEKRPGTGTFTE